MIKTQERSQEEQTLVNFALKYIKTKSLDELLDMYNSNSKVSIREMISSGLQFNQLEQFPDAFLMDIINSGEITAEELQDAGISDERMNQIQPTKKNSDFGNQTVQDSDPFASPFDFNKGLTIVEEIETNIIDRIRNKEATAVEVRDALKENKISDSDLINQLGYSLDMVKMIRSFEPQITYFPPLTELPPLQSGATDIYFLGMPGSGKSTLLASFLHYANRAGLLRREVTNSHGTKYANELMTGMAQGYLPSSTPTELINYIPISLRSPDKADSYRKLNLIDMAGEKFRKVGTDGIREFRAIRDYLSNDNSKCLIFMLDYFEEDEILALMEQDQNLQEVLAQLDNAGVLAKTETIYMVVTKADLFPTGDPRSFAKDYIENNYKNFLSYCREMKKANKITLKSFPYSIGPSTLTYLLKDRDPRTNKNLDYYPNLMVEQIIEDFPYISNRGFFRR
jgi:hypothetical protein